MAHLHDDKNMYDDTKTSEANSRHSTHWPPHASTCLGEWESLHMPPHAYEREGHMPPHASTCEALPPPPSPSLALARTRSQVLAVAGSGWQFVTLADTRSLVTLADTRSHSGLRHTLSEAHSLTLASTHSHSPALARTR